MTREGRRMVDREDDDIGSERGGRRMVDRQDDDIRSEMEFHGERTGEREIESSRNLADEERGVSLVRMSRNGDGKSRIFSRSNGQDVPIRDGDTALKFEWTNLLRESGNSMADGVERGYQGSGSANNGRNLLPNRSEEIRTLPTNEFNASSAEYRGRTRNVTHLLVENPEYHGRSRNVVVELPNEGVEYRRQNRNVIDLPNEGAGYRRPNWNVTDLLNEGAEYRRQNRIVSGFRIEDTESYGHTRNSTGYRIENVDYNRKTRDMTSLPVKDAEYRGRTRKETGLSVKDAEYHRRTRTVMTSHPVEDGGGILVRDYSQHVDGEIRSFKSYEDGNRLRFRGEDSSRSLTPRSQSSGQHTPLQGIPFSNLEVPRQVDFHHTADGLGTSGNNPSSSCYNSHGLVYSEAGTNTLPTLNDDGAYLRAAHNSNTGRHVEYVHSESQRSGKSHRRALSEDLYDRYENVQDYNNYGESSGNDSMDPALTRHVCIGNSYNHALEDDRQHTSNQTLQEPPIVNVESFRRTAHEIEYGGVELKPVNSCVEYQTRANYETTPHEDEYPYEIDAYGVSYEGQIGSHPTSEEGTLIVDEDAELISRSGYVALHDQPTRISKRKRGLVGKKNGPKHRISTLGGGGALSYDNQLGHSNRSSSHYINSNETAKKPKTKSRLPFGGLSKKMQSRLCQPCETNSNDIKNRLNNPPFVPRCYGPKASKFLKGNVKSTVKPSLNVDHIDSQPYGKDKCTSSRKRLKRPSFMDVSPSNPQVSHSELDIESQQKLTAKNSASTKEASLPREADPDHSILKVKPVEKDRPENSEELKRQVDHWCLKCMFYLNANPGRQKKFKEQGKAGTLKCIICASSKEFIQTKDVAMHAFTSLKVGFRAAHLGFHRALCILMGWDPAVTSNGRWGCQSLPDVEAWALKEDIIVWPPVFVIHNGSARDVYNNEQGKISIEQLENILRDMGLSEGKATICHGKPGNPNIMLAKFSGTLSGLQEAEKLHTMFSEKKHGRAELQEIDAGIGCNEGVSPKPEDKLQEIDAGIGCNEGVSPKPEDKTEDALYGYLAIVEDFDKLNYDTRRHCVAKSKKEILACMDTA